MATKAVMNDVGCVANRSKNADTKQFYSNVADVRTETSSRSNGGAGAGVGAGAGAGAGAGDYAVLLVGFRTDQSGICVWANEPAHINK